MKNTKKLFFTAVLATVAFTGSVFAAAEPNGLWGKAQQEGVGSTFKSEDLRGSGGIFGVGKYLRNRSLRSTVVSVNDKSENDKSTNCVKQALVLAAEADADTENADVTLHVLSQSPIDKSLLAQALDWLASSRFACIWNEGCSQRLDLEGVPAPSEWQEMGQEAQAVVGIPSERRVPIRELEKIKGASACAAENAIYLDSSYFNGDAYFSYGEKRCTVYHEAVHVKYNDSSFRRLLCAAPVMLPFLLLPRRISGALLGLGRTAKICYLSSPAVACYLGCLVEQKHPYHSERRADIEGCHATGCYVCVDEKARGRRDSLNYINARIRILSESSSLDDGDGEELRTCEKDRKEWARYASPDEIQQIADVLRQESKMCSFHKEHAQQ